jgi:dihydrodiol dehydrogenase / D-xylose 1-dehydrogenase (NADP)
MEGLWSRFFPAWRTMREWIDAGRIGETRMAQASFGFRSGWNPESRLLNPALGGGALWDVGIYTLAFASSVLGTDLRDVRALAQVGETGVDEQVSLLLRFGGGKLANLNCAVRTGTPHEAWVAGTEGRILVDQPFWRPRRIRLERSPGQCEEDLDLAFQESGFQFEATHVRDCLRAGLLESPVVPLAESLLWQGIMDEALAQVRPTRP